MITPEDATLIIKGWQERNSDLLLSASMINFSVYAKCRVVSLDGGNVTLWSIGKDSAVFTFSVASKHVSLKYSEMRDFKGRPGLEEVPEDKLLNSALVLTIPLEAIASPSGGFDVEQIFLLEL